MKKSGEQMKTFKYLKKQLYIRKPRFNIFERKITMEDKKHKNDFMDLVNAYKNLDYEDLNSLAILFPKDNDWRDKAIRMAMSGKSFETDKISRGNEYQGQSIDSLAYKIHYDSVLDDLGCLEDE